MLLTTSLDMSQQLIIHISYHYCASSSCYWRYWRRGVSGWALWWCIVSTDHTNILMSSPVNRQVSSNNSSQNSLVIISGGGTYQQTETRVWSLQNWICLASNFLPNILFDFWWTIRSLLIALSQIIKPHPFQEILNYNLLQIKNH